MSTGSNIVSLDNLSKAPDQDSPIDSRFTEEVVAGHGAQGVVCWRVDNHESAVVVQATTELSPCVMEKSQELATRAIRSRSPECAVLASPEKLLIVAHPINRSTNDCVSVAFPCDITHLAESAMEERLQAVGRLSESIARNQTTTSSPRVQRLSAPHLPPACGSAESDADDDADERNAPESLLPSWSELLQQILRKALAELRELKSSCRYCAVVLIALAGIGSIPYPYTVSCRTVCEPSVRRYVAAPFDARIARVHVVSGQSVKQGDVLVTLDGSDLRSELAGLRAEATQAQQRLLAALSSGDHSQAEFERLETEHMSREIELLTRRQSELEIRAPIDGMIVTSDLERSEGMRLSMGEHLLEIASLDQLIAEIAIPENEVNHVAEQMQVNILLDAVPGRDGTSKVTKIHLRSELRDNASVFIGEAKLDNADRLLRPGMNGTARIRTGNHPLAWILFHRPVNELRHWVGW